MSAKTEWSRKKAGPSIWEIDRKTGAHRIYAAGLRNPNGMAWEPTTGALWTVVNERDEIGSDLVPDYLTSVRRWRVLWLAIFVTTARMSMNACKPPRPDLVASAIVPDYALGPHTASLGLAWSAGIRCPLNLRTACSSASTVRGTASRTAATR